MNLYPLVSVIIPVYNRTAYLGEAISSVLAQDSAVYEIIVVDDGSTKDIVGALLPFRDRIKVLTIPHGGPSAARNAGVKSANGKYIAFLDDDDLFESGKLKEQVRQMETNPLAGFLYSSVYYLGENGKKRLHSPRARLASPEKFAKMYFMDIDLTMPSLLVRRSAFLEAGMFDENIVYNEDFDLWLRIAMKFPVIYSDTPSALVRLHEASLTYKNPEMLEGLIRVLYSALDRFPELRRELGTDADAKIAYQHYTLAWSYLAKRNRASAKKHFEIYKNSAGRKHSAWVIKILMSIPSFVPSGLLLKSLELASCARGFFR